MGRFFARIFWSLRRATNAPSEAQLINQRIDAVSARLMALEDQVRKGPSERWTPPAQVTPLWPQLVDDN